MNLTSVFAVLRPDMRVDLIEKSPTVYDELDARYDRFANHALVAVHEFDADWGVWEQHPKGDEIVVLLSGEVTFRLMTAGGDEDVSLAVPGDFAVVPRGVWHTALTSVATRLLFVTPGEGTQNKIEVS